ncbi:hypothetical protein [Nonomuraea sp. bgisy101]|uniref:hypothetical protein n=1 Tax=Nonomuraea sp. bgisy101 TaxID=3413784 RepID=UPI003D760A2D
MPQPRETMAGYPNARSVVFPQSGIVSGPGVADLILAATRRPSTEAVGDPDVPFALAARHDIHLSEGGSAALSVANGLVLGPGRG